MKTLIVDDDTMVREALRHLLGQFGIVDEGENGVEGIRYIEESYRLNQPYNLILLDIVLPELDGYALIRKVRECEQTHNVELGKETKIVVISSRYDEPTILEAVGYGAMGVVQKPINSETVLNNIKRLRVVA